MKQHGECLTVKGSHFTPSCDVHRAPSLAHGKWASDAWSYRNHRECIPCGLEHRTIKHGIAGQRSQSCSNFFFFLLTPSQSLACWLFSLAWITVCKLLHLYHYLSSFTTIETKAGANCCCCCCLTSLKTWCLIWNVSGCLLLQSSIIWTGDMY